MSRRLFNWKTVTSAVLLGTAAGVLGLLGFFVGPAITVEEGVISIGLSDTKRALASPGISYVRTTEGAIANSSLTLNIEVSSGTDRCLVVGLAYKSNSPLTPTSILFNTSESFTVELAGTDAANAQCFLYYLTAPTETTADVVITMPSSVRMVGYVAYFTGVDQSDPFTANTDDNQGTNDNPTVTITSDTDEMVVDIMAQVSAGPDTITANSGTKICDGAATGGGTDTRGGGQYEVGSVSVTSEYTMSGSEDWNIVAGSLQEPSAVPDISNSPSTWTLNGITGGGEILINTTYYANPNGDTTTPNSPVVNGDCRFLITNSSSMNINLAVIMGTFSGGDANMTNSDTGSNGSTSYGSYCWNSGDTYPGGRTIVKSSGSDTMWTSSTPGDDIYWGAEVVTQTNAWTGGAASTATMTITATAS